MVCSHVPVDVVELRFKTRLHKYKHATSGREIVAVGPGAGNTHRPMHTGLCTQAWSTHTDSDADNESVHTKAYDTHRERERERERKSQDDTM